MRPRCPSLLRALVVSVLLPAASPLFCDVLVLKDGKTVEGELQDKGASYEVRTKYGVLTIDKTDVKKIVKDAAAMAAEAESLHGAARSMYEDALKIEDDAKERNRKLTAAVEILEKALSIYNEARVIFTGDAYGYLDTAAATLIQEMRLYRDKMTTEQTVAPPPPAPAPPAPDAGAATPEPKPEPLESPVPPSLPDAAAKAGPPPPPPKAGPWDFIRERKASLQGKRLKVRFTTVGEQTVEVQDVLDEEVIFAVVAGKSSTAGREKLSNVAPGGVLALARAAADEKDASQLLRLAEFHAQGDVPDEAVGYYARALSGGADGEAGRQGLEQGLETVRQQAAAGALTDAAGVQGRLQAVRGQHAAAWPTPLKEALDRTLAAVQDAVRWQQGAKILEQARQAAERKKHAEAWTLASRVVKQFPGTPVAAEAQALLDTLPHPDGRLVCGFDSDADLKAWKVFRRGNTDIRFDLTTDEKEVHEGKGAAHFALGKSGIFASETVVLELGDFDEARFRGISLWVFVPLPSQGRLQIAFIRPKQTTIYWSGRLFAECLYRDVDLNWTGWRQVKIPAAEFQSRGKFTWPQAGALMIYDASDRGCDVILDSLRILEAEKK